jgi:hypothetical protein
MNQFETNEIRGREYIQNIFDDLGIDVTFTTGKFSTYDFSFEYKNKKCIGEVKYLYKYDSNSFPVVYLEQKKAKNMEIAMNSTGNQSMFYFFIYNDDSCRMFNITKFRKYQIEEKLAPKSYSDKTRILKRFIVLPNEDGFLI